MYQNLVPIMLIIVRKAFEIADTKDSKMVSSVPVKKQLMAVKLETCQAGYWCEISFTAKGIARTFHRGYYQYYKKYVNVKKGGVAGISRMLAVYVLFNHCCCYKEYHWKGPSVEAFCIPAHDFCPTF